MAEHVERLRANAILGVGAGFDIHAGTLSQAPFWMQRIDLEWAYRLRREPPRLWRRYLLNNPAFVVHVLVRRPGLVQAPNTNRSRWDPASPREELHEHSGQRPGPSVEPDDIGDR